INSRECNDDRDIAPRSIGVLSASSGIPGRKSSQKCLHLSKRCSPPVTFAFPIKPSDLRDILPSSVRLRKNGKAQRQSSSKQ
ncbi:hypothetical protein M422DRAFT_30891, partial [Sphaerobolus stellatus SS14]